MRNIHRIINICFVSLLLVSCQRKRSGSSSIESIISSSSSESSELSYDSSDYSSLIPTFNFDVGDNKIPDRSDPEYKNYAPCEITFASVSSVLSDEEGRIRIRGTSSRWFPKKGYKIKFSKKTSLLDLPKSKKYNLLASFLDPSMLRDYLAMSISYSLNSNSKRWAPKIRLVKVFINDDYQGLYYLIDDISDGSGKIELNKYSPEDETIPFILEMDTIADRQEDKKYFELGETDVFDYDGDGKTPLYYKVDTPEDVSDIQLNNIAKFMTICRDYLANNDLVSFHELVDINSFIDFFLLAELFRNTDLAGRSTYMYRLSTDGKLIFGPSWDFDYTCSRPYSMEPNTDYTLENAKDRFYNYDWWKLFLECDYAKEIIRKRYVEYFKPIVIHHLNEMNEYINFYDTEIMLNGQKWYEKYDVPELVTNNYNWTNDYFSLRMEMMDEVFDEQTE